MGDETQKTGRGKSKASLSNLTARGRPKGVQNKATLKREKEIAASGLTPLDFMLSVLRNEANDLETRLDASKSAAPYVHPKLAQIAHTGPNGNELIITVRDV